MCGGRSRSTLSVGLGDTGAVLLKCWKSGCAPEQIAAALGLDINALFPDAPDHPPLRRRRLMPAHQALEILNREATLVLLCASDMARGETLDEATRARLLTSAARITLLLDEAGT